MDNLVSSRGGACARNVWSHGIVEKFLNTKAVVNGNKRRKEDTMYRKGEIKVKT